MGLVPESRSCEAVIVDRSHDLLEEGLDFSALGCALLAEGCGALPQGCEAWEAGSVALQPGYARGCSASGGVALSLGFAAGCALGCEVWVAGCEALAMGCAWAGCVCDSGFWSCDGETVTALTCLCQSLSPLATTL